MPWYPWFSAFVAHLVPLGLLNDGVSVRHNCITLNIWLVKYLHLWLWDIGPCLNYYRWSLSLLHSPSIPHNSLHIFWFKTLHMALYVGVKTSHKASNIIIIRNPRVFPSHDVQQLSKLFHISSCCYSLLDIMKGSDNVTNRLNRFLLDKREQNLCQGTLLGAYPFPLHHCTTGPLR